MAVYTRNNIVTNGLVLNLDPQNPQSIPNDPIVNLLYTNGTYTPIVGTLTIVPNLSTIQPNIKFRISTTTYVPPYTYGNFRLYIPLSVLTNGKSYTLSYNYQIISGSDFFMTDWCDTVLFNTVNTNLGTYSYSSATGVRSTYNSTYRFMDFNIGENTIVDIWDMQFVQNTYSPPFTTSSRAVWYDMSGNNNIATLTSSSTSGSIPQYSSLNSRVLQFDGTSSYASIPNSSNLVFGNGDFTVGMWIKTPISSVGEGSPSQWGPIISKGCTTSAPAGTWWFAQNSTNNNRITFNISSTIGSEFVCSLTTPTLVDGWHNVVFTRSGSTGTLYTDGVRSSIDTTTDSDLFSTAPIYLGSTSPRPQKKTGMGLSQVQIYNRALSQVEITQNYNALKSRFGLQ